MSDTFQCGDNTALVGYLYDECDPVERQAIETHVGVCAACAAELAALESTRVQLASWTPPEIDLGFAVTRPHPSTGARGALSEVEGQASGLRPQAGALGPGPRAWYRQPMPAWAQAIAACAIFAVGVWLGVERGRAPASAQTEQAAAVAQESPAASPASAADLAALERRLRTEMVQIRGNVPSPAAAGARSSEGDAQLLARVRALITESEQRQQRALAMGMTQVVNDFEVQRRVDLAQIQRTLGQMEGLTGAEVRDQRQMLNYLMRVSQQGR
ncbi:MAG: zf-HC2 domain-containing protein [Acidobacteria bacterium]|nr:zf-HC2 domain-containing protein [Acidobacteriota bacterium]